MGIGEAMDMMDEINRRKNRPTRVYVASSWKNQYQPEVVKAVRKMDWEVFDFRNPAPGNTGFQWRNTIPGFNPDACTVEQFNEVLEHPVARHGAALDVAALISCDVCIMVLPCGNSSHIELGYAIGASKIGVIWAPVDFKADLMYAMAHYMSDDLPKVLRYVDQKVSEGWRGR